MAVKRLRNAREDQIKSYTRLVVVLQVTVERLDIPNLHSKVLSWILKRMLLCINPCICCTTCTNNQCMPCSVVGALVNIWQTTSRPSCASIKELFVCCLLLLGMLGSFLFCSAQLLTDSHVPWCQLLGCFEALYSLLVVLEP